MLKHIHLEKENLIISSVSDLCEIFESGYKSCEEKNIGIELEKLPVNKSNFKASSYMDVARFLLDFKNSKWHSVQENGSILGLSSEEGTISLEPGSQTEISLNPKSSLKDVETYLKNYDKKTSQIAQKYGIYWLGCGIQPVSVYRNINIIPKKRYEYMTKYLPMVAKKPLVMMRETAGIQVSVDYSNEQDAMNKFSIALKLSPLMSAMFANSPIRNSRLTKYKSNRAASWLDTDNDRCGLVSPKALVANNFSFMDYVEILLDVPMIFIERNLSEISKEKTAIKVDNMTFRQFMEKGYQGYSATKEDWILHMSLYFPDVRFKNYIEIRNHDNQKSELICSVPAFWKGIIYNNQAIDAINEILKPFAYFDFEYMRRKTPQKGLDMIVKRYKLSELVKEIVKISYDSLKSYQQGEEKYLEPLITILNDGLTPADLIIKKWQNEWNGNIKNLIDYSRIS